MNIDLDKLRFPIGRYQKPEQFDMQVFQSSMKTLEELPDKLLTAVEHLTDDQLNKRYRKGGWTIRQVVHHIADAHINGYVRTKLALTEDNPTIKPYNQEEWAKLSDASEGPIEDSLLLIEALHKRWVALFKSLAVDDFKKTFYHPESKQKQSVGLWITIYAWHCDHHLSHITSLIERSGW